MKLDMHCEMILEEYHEKQPIYLKMQEFILEKLKKSFETKGVVVAGIESRIKTEKSLIGKLEIKGYKYKTIADITDILGVRVITNYSDDVDIVAAIVENMFEMDWDNSVDKRKMLDFDRFGYISLHYICRIPASLFHDDAMPEINELRFEIQMCSSLQHVWANMHHDTGYKTEVEIPVEYQRNMSRLAGMLELIDEQFSRIRKEITDYRRKVQALVATGNFDEVPLNGDTFRSYLELKPFKRLADKIASINQAEIYEDSLMPYYNVLIRMNMKTLGDVGRMYKECKDAAYQLALLQLAGTGLDIVAYSVTLQNLCIVYILKKGFGEGGLVQMFALLYGKSDYNNQRAHRIYEQATKLKLV
ncbi:MAG: hypothetical protein SPK72_05240 [Bacteroidales bacterium]|jgi:ppGpp synthetase/RelA/SpoT-type nucleotidyltranferase|nr:hypothetical protein [Bacteroidales bacterium]